MVFKYNYKFLCYSLFKKLSLISLLLQSLILSDLLLIKYGGNDGVWHPRVGHKIYGGFHPSLWIIHPERIMGHTCCKTIPVALWRSPRCKEPRGPSHRVTEEVGPLANSHVSEPSWNYPAPVGLHMTAAPSSFLILETGTTQLNVPCLTETLS